MGKSFEEQIKESMEGYREQPPGNCWDSLSQQLDALHQAAVSSQAPLTEAARTSASKAVLGSAAAKMGIGAAVVGGMIAAGTWLFTPKTEETSSTPNPAQNILSADTLTEDSTYCPETTPSQVHENDIYGNTTFSEGIPAYLFEESEHTVSIEENNRTTHSADSTREYIPQAVAQKMDSQAAAATENGTYASHNTPSEKTTGTEKDVNTPPLQPELRIPNVITPNGDNINDYFAIENLEMTEGNRLIIYNRYNKIVFERKNYGNNWNADNLPEGVYRYWLSFEYAGHEFMRQGSIKVMR